MAFIEERNKTEKKKKGIFSKEDDGCYSRPLMKYPCNYFDCQNLISLVMRCSLFVSFATRCAAIKNNLRIF